MEVLASGPHLAARSRPALVYAATFESMRDSADTLVPTAGIFKSNAAFFRRGTSRAGRDTLSDEELAAYCARVTQPAPSTCLPGSTPLTRTGECFLLPIDNNRTKV